MNRGVRIGMIIAGVVVIIAFALGALSPDTDDGDVANDGETSDIFSLSFEDSDGNEVNLADYSGTPLVVNSWATWCSFCVKELPDFATVQEELGGEVLIIAINRRETPARAKEFTDSLGVTDRLVFLLDERDEFYRSIGGRAMPETLFIDSSGTTVEHKRGVMGVEEIREKINQII
jgi:thiol-disulfide isomerase/thioredoxin